ncbi:Crp/Fnr family transcriptional regulator [Methylobacterium sp. J-076]|uniref:Crp/Fnr family transcriptional regulator n=1 Tax=Methylobacterium sp. J-076 TaxID=2836655 RepID=UPI001FBB2743|nr:Crp/Fnr family transcriptional regulator [Methylobacterium sp. J-076]MCJ2014161.1 Crp/Fnr family transcriptional regulator [Methylobacterium sp. J-076]
MRTVEPRPVDLDANLLLQALEPRDRALIAKWLEPRDVRRGDVLFRAGEDVSHVTFPLDRSIVTLLVTLKDGKTVETATVGREGAIGGVVSNGCLPAFSHAVVQVEGRVLRIEAERLQRAKQASIAVRDLFVRYSDCLVAQLLQSVACNAVHSLEQRTMRWLLTLQDRLGTADLPVTHEVLAEMLGVRRAYLTETLGKLQREGLVRTGRGQLTLVDRAKAERASCECHGNVRRHFVEVLGAVYGRRGRILGPSSFGVDKPLIEA